MCRVILWSFLKEIKIVHSLGFAMTSITSSFIESSIFSNMDEREAVLSSWRSLSTFYESFLAMASSVWTLQKLALSFDPVVEIFQVESGVDFSIVFMEDVLRRKQDKKLTVNLTRGKVVGFTVIQSQVYLTSLKCK